MISCLHQLVSNAAKETPNNIAIIEAGKPAGFVTYRRLDEKIQFLSSQLLQKGLNKGERVGILSRNSIMFAALYFAICRAGGVAVPFNHTLDSRDIIKEANNCALSAIYAGKGFKKKAKDIIEKVKSIRFIVEDSADNIKVGKFPSVSEDDLTSIIYTSGTTRNPLGVMLSHRNLISNNKSIVQYARITDSDRICCVLPFYYIYGLSLLFSHFLARGTIIIDNQFMYPNVVLDTIDKYKATGFAGVSSHYAILLYKSDFKKRRLPSLRYFMQAGDKMSPNITKELINTFPDKKLYIMYGQTEASPRLTYLDPCLIKKKPNSIGKAIPGVEVKVVNKRTGECKAGEAGEIIARGDNITSGYWNDDKETVKIIKNGWLYTGDIAFKDTNGDLFIVGRKKNFIKVGANRINPIEIEDLMVKDERIMEAAVIGIPDAILGEKIKLFVTLIPGRKMAEEEIIKFCKARMPSYKLPSEVTSLKIMPKNSFGKIDKEKLRLM